MTALAAMVLGVTVAGGLWPFGGQRDGADGAGEPTIASLKEPRSGPAARAGKAPGSEAPAATAPGDSAARAMAAYQRFLTLEGGSPEMRAEATRRLADLHLDAGIAAEAAEENPGAGTAHYLEAVKLYQELLATGLVSTGEDQVRYQLARALEGAGQADLALVTLDQLVAQPGTGRHQTEAQFRRGETYFMRQDYATAEAAYAAVLAAGEATGFHEQALYKLGWSRFKQGRLEEGLQSFLTVIDRRLGADPDPARGLAAMTRPERELLDDTLRVSSITFSYLEGPESLAATLEARGARPWDYLLYTALGDLYLEQERFRDAAGAYEAFVSRHPAATPAPALQQAAIEAYVKGRFPSLVLAAKRQYVDRYGLDAAYWQGRDPAAPAEATVVAQLKTHLSDLAAHDHALAQQSRDPADYGRAADWYRRFLAYFPRDPDSAQRSFLLGELLFEARQFGEARDAYLRSAYEYGVHDRAAEAGYAALLAGREQEALLAPEARPAWRAENLEHGLRFARTFPDHPRAASVLSDAAEAFFAAGDLDRAIATAALVLTHQPPADRRLEQVAWTVTAHAQFDLGRFAEAEQSYLSLRTYGLPMAERTAVDARIAAAIYRQAEAAQAAGQVDPAVAHYLRIAEAAPDADIRPNALYDAATLLYDGQRWSEAADLLQRFRREFPGHRFADPATVKLAESLRAGGRTREAAVEFEKLADNASLDGEARRQALWQAAELHAAAGQAADEARVYEMILARHPEPFAPALEARWRLASLAADRQDWPGRQRWLRELMAADGRAGVARTDRSRYLAALAAIELARPHRDAFMATALAMPLDRSLRLKRSRMEEALEAYGRAAAYGVAEVTTAATFETAELYYQLGRDLMASERPPGLNEEELEQYELLLEEQAFPFEEKALEIYRANAARAADGVYDEWVRASFARLAAIAPGRYAREERSQGVATWID